jgi:hypothetical protein
MNDSCTLLVKSPTDILEKLQYVMASAHHADQQHVAAILAELAGILLQQVVLRVGNSKYQIADIEFYLHSDQHKDEFIHGDVEQQQSGRWYYNLAGGVDLTFGNGKGYGGILLRGLLRLNGSVGTVYGPQRVLRELVASQAPVWEVTNGWILEVCETVPGRIWQTVRVGLKKEVSLEAEVFRLLPYRFVAHADYLRQLPNKEQNKLYQALGMTKAEVETL